MINESIQFINTTSMCAATAITHAGYPWYILVFTLLGILYLITAVVSQSGMLIMLGAYIYAGMKWIYNKLMGKNI